MSHLTAHLPHPHLPHPHLPHPDLHRVTDAVHHAGCEADQGGEGAHDLLVRGVARVHDPVVAGVLSEVDGTLARPPRTTTA